MRKIDSYEVFFDEAPDLVALLNEQGFKELRKGRYVELNENLFLAGMQDIFDVRDGNAYGAGKCSGTIGSLYITPYQNTGGKRLKRVLEKYMAGNPDGKQKEARH